MSVPAWPRRRPATEPAENAQGCPGQPGSLGTASGHRDCTPRDLGCRSSITGMPRTQGSDAVAAQTPEFPGWRSPSAGAWTLVEAGSSDHAVSWQQACNEAGSEATGWQALPPSALVQPLSSPCPPLASRWCLAACPSAFVCAGPAAGPVQRQGPTAMAGRTGACRRPAPSPGRASPPARGTAPVRAGEHAQLGILGRGLSPRPGAAWNGAGRCSAHRHHGGRFAPLPETGAKACTFWGEWVKKAEPLLQWDPSHLPCGSGPWEEGVSRGTEHTGSPAGDSAGPGHLGAPLWRGLVVCSSACCAPSQDCGACREALVPEATEGLGLCGRHQASLGRPWCHSPHFRPPFSSSFCLSPNPWEMWHESVDRGPL